MMPGCSQRRSRPGRNRRVPPVRLFYYKGLGGVGNFGDELNPYLWDRLLPDLDQRGSPDWLFVGIGTLLNDRLPKASRTIVFGSGVGYGTGVPTPDSSWQIYFVRGPRSAAALGLPPDVGLTDPAILVSRVWRERLATRTRCSFMPHFVNANSWIESLCQEKEMGISMPAGRWRGCCVRSARLASFSPRRCTVPSWQMLCACLDSGLQCPGCIHFQVARLVRLDWLALLPAVDCVPLGAFAGRTVFGSARAWAKATIVGHQLRRIARTVRPCLSSDRTSQDLLAAVERKLDEFRVATGRS